MGQASVLRFGATRTRGMRVLLADAHRESRSSLAEELRGDGHEVVAVAGATELLFALQVVDDGVGCAPDVLIVDTTMSHGSAGDVLAAYRDAVADALVIVIDDEHEDDACSRLEPCLRFRRPFDREDVRTAVLNARAVHPKRFVGFPHLASMTKGA